MSQYLTFQLDGKFYGVGVAYINSVLDPQDITPLPHTSTIVTGLTNVRGIVVPVFDPRMILASMRIDDAGNPVQKVQAMVAADPAYDSRSDSGLIIFEIANGTLLPFIGIEVDRIGKVIQLREGQLAPVPPFLHDSASQFLEGFCFVGEDRHAILNLPALVERERLFNESGGAYA